MKVDPCGDGGNKVVVNPEAYNDCIFVKVDSWNPNDHPKVCDTLYYLADGSGSYVWDGTNWIFLNFSGGGGSGQPTLIDSTTLDVNGSGTYNVNVNLNQDAKDALAKAETALQDAPKDGDTYGRKDGQWVTISSESGLSYGRADLGEYGFNKEVGTTLVIQKSDVTMTVGALTVGSVLYDDTGGVAFVNAINGENVTITTVTATSIHEEFTASTTENLPTTIGDEQLVNVSSLTILNGESVIINGTVFDASGTISRITDVSTLDQGTITVTVISVGTGILYYGETTAALASDVGDTVTIDSATITDKVGALADGGSLLDPTGILGVIIDSSDPSAVLVQTVSIPSGLEKKVWYVAMNTKRTSYQEFGYDTVAFSINPGASVTVKGVPAQAKKGDIVIVEFLTIPAPRSFVGRLLKDGTDSSQTSNVQVITGASTFQAIYANILTSSTYTGAEPQEFDVIGVVSASTNGYPYIDTGSSFSNMTGNHTGSNEFNSINKGDLLYGLWKQGGKEIPYVAICEYVQQSLHATTSRKGLRILSYKQPNINLSQSVAYSNIFGSSVPAGNELSAELDGIEFIWEKYTNGFYLPKIRNNRSETIKINYAFDHYYGLTASQQMAGSNITLAPGEKTGSLEADNYGLGYSSSNTSGASLYNGYITVITSTTREAYNWHSEGDTSGATAPSSGSMSMQVVQRYKLAPQ